MRALRRHWASFRRRDRAARLHVLEAATALAAVWLGLRMAGYRRTRAAVGRVGPMHQDARRSSHEIEALSSDLARAVAAAGQAVPFAPTCLHRTLALAWMLRRRGIATDVRIGAVRMEAGLAAHAWLERDGVVLNDEADVGEHFVAFPRDA